MIIIDEKYRIIPTIFPDKTSQVWKLPKEILGNNSYSIQWFFESEAEFFHLAQLVELLRHHGTPRLDLEIPYLPYARQDKAVDNEASFALHTFARQLNALDFNIIKVFDVHSPDAFRLINRLREDGTFIDIVNQVVVDSKADVICYPDAGALQRYKGFLDPKIPYCSFSKERDPLTGYIKKLTLNEKVELKDKRVLIIDDLCDGGMTFILTTKELLNYGVSNVDLYVSHGIFSKGTQVLRDAGINTIYLGAPTYEANTDITL
jgi:ribose-phosphate pyrophosphokinase